MKDSGSESGWNILRQHRQQVSYERWVQIRKCSLLMAHSQVPPQHGFLLKGAVLLKVITSSHKQCVANDW